MYTFSKFYLHHFVYTQISSFNRSILRTVRQNARDGEIVSIGSIYNSAIPTASRPVLYRLSPAPKNPIRDPTPDDFASWIHDEGLPLLPGGHDTVNLFAYMLREADVVEAKYMCVCSYA